MMISPKSEPEGHHRRRHDDPRWRDHDGGGLANRRGGRFINWRRRFINRRRGLTGRRTHHHGCWPANDHLLGRRPERQCDTKVQPHASL